MQPFQNVPFVVAERKPFELASPLNILIGSQFVRVEDHEGHREVRVVSHFADGVNCVQFGGKTRKVGEFELGNCKEVRRSFHGLLQLFEFLPEVVELAPISHEVHLGVELRKKVVEVF